MQNSVNFSTISRNNFRNQNNDVRVNQAMCDFKAVELIHLALISELDAINNYENWANQISNENAKKVLREIRNEERVHAGELLTLIQTLCPQEIEYFNKGKEEVMNIIGNNTMQFN